MKKERPVGTKAFREAWKRHRPLRDTWGVEYVYDYGAYAIWKAAIRHERKQRAHSASPNTGET